MRKTIFNAAYLDWVLAKNKCRVTVGKESTDSVPSLSFRRRLLISEHSPIRVLTVDWTWKTIKSWVATHWSRHKWECFIETQRSDRTGIDRDQSAQGTPDEVAAAIADDFREHVRKGRP